MQPGLDRRQWTEMQHYTLPNHNPPPPADPYSHQLYSTHYSSHYTQNPIPNPSPYAPVGPPKPHERQYMDPVGPRPVETLSYASSGSLTHSYGGAYQAYAPSHHRTIDAGSVAAPYVYYQEPNVVSTVRNWPIGVTIQQHVPQQSVPPVMVPQAWTNATVHPNGTRPSKNGPKKVKIVQSVWCDLCKIDCNSKDMLDKHKLGKKHKKNLEKLIQTANAPTVSSNPIIGPPENPNQGKRKKASESLEGSVTKKKKTSEGGSVDGAMRRCNFCNVLCNSDKVFQTHLVGKKHITTMKNRAKEV